MGMTLRNPSQEDFNQLKKMLADGIITPQQLQTMPMDVGYDGPPEKLDQGSQNMLAQMMQSQSMQQSPQAMQGGSYVQMDGGPQRQIGQSNGPSPQQLSDQASISQNADGVALSKLTAGGGYQGLKSGQGLIRMTQPDGSTEDRYINSAPAQAAPMKLYGFDNGSLTSLGNADAGAVADVSRNMVEVPGLGKGYYSKDGKSAIISNPDGSKSQVLLGYDREASQAIDDRNMQRQKMRGDIAQNEAQTAFTQAKTDELLRPGDPAGNGAVSLTELVDPKDASRLLRVDARTYKGGSLGDVGVMGVSGKEPTAAKREETANQGRDGLAADIQLIRDSYKKLDDLKAIPNKDRDVLDNIMSSAQASGIGQTLGNITGTSEQEQRNEIQAARRRLLSSIKNISGASSQEMNSNVELKTWMDSLGDVSKPVGGNLAILDAIENKYLKAKTTKDTKPNLIRSPEVSQSLANARAAIKRGISPEIVIKKLRDNGITENP